MQLLKIVRQIEDIVTVV